MRIYPASDSQMRELIENEPDSEMRQAYAEMLDGCINHPDKRCWYAVWFMEKKDGGKPIGDLCFKGLSEDGAVEIGYGTYAGFEGRGYMTEAVKALVKWASAQPGVRRIEAETDPGNRASQRVLEKSGFVPNGKTGREGPRFVWAGITHDGTGIR